MNYFQLTGNHSKYISLVITKEEMFYSANFNIAFIWETAVGTNKKICKRLARFSWSIKRLCKKSFLYPEYERAINPLNKILKKFLHPVNIHFCIYNDAALVLSLLSFAQHQRNIVESDVLGKGIFCISESLF